ncbi:hypothetical protein [Streptomyces sp. NPDC058964]|uniref:hypothetical protein n=1 Tax=Streptomyces sp. NPDC058964 TaxID=3346681 RepID=UPI00367C5676
MRGDIWIGDVVRALDAAQPGADKIAIARLLGFRLIPGGAAATEPTDRQPLLLADGPVEISTAGPVDRHADGPSPERGRPPTVPSTVDVPLLRPVGAVHRQRATLSGEGLARVEPAHAQASVPLPPLFAPGSAAAILQGALSRREHVGDIDPAPLIQSLSRGRPVARIPRKPILTLRHGVEVLVDLGPGMLAFRRDQEEVMRRIVEVAGRESVRFRYFATTPALGVGPEGRWSWRPYPGPERGFTVLLLSDLGLGSRPDERRDRPEDWLALAEQVTRAQGELVAFLPFPSDRRPAWSASTPIRILTWDRVTTVADARRRP